MKKSSLFNLVALVMVFSMLLAACQPAAVPAPTAAPVATSAPAATATTAAVAATAAPVATTAPAATATTAAPAFTGLKTEATDCKYGGEFKSIEAVDAKTVKFTLCFADPAFPAKAAFDVFAITSKASLDKLAGDSVKMSDAPVGTGPFVLKEWKRGDSITYTANPNYWGGAVPVKTLVIKWSDQAAQRLLQLQSGQADGIDNPAPEDFDAISKDTTLALIPRDALNIFYLGMNNKMAPFDNEKIRQAFAQAIDRQRIVDQFYPKGSRVADVFVPPALKPGYSDVNKWYDYNPDAAKKLLADAGWKSSTVVTLSYRNVVRSYLPSPDKVGQEIQAQLKAVGVTVKLEQVESAAFLDATSKGQKAFFMLGWGADYPDATNFYDYHFTNFKGFGDFFPDVVTPIQAAAKLSDPAARQAQYDLANAAIKTHVPMIPIAHGASAVAFKSDVKNAMTSPLGNEPFFLMDAGGRDTLVFVQNGEPAALWCSDETDGEALRACMQIFEPLLRFKAGTAQVEPALAASYVASADLMTYTFTLRDGVKFSDGTVLNANDVVASYVSQWDAKDPDHKGRTGTFEYFGSFFGTFLNAPPAK